MPKKYDRWYLKNSLDLKQLNKLFRYFSAVTNLDVVLFDSAGREIFAIKKEYSVCYSAKNGLKCREYIKSGSIQSFQLGEPYICTCGCGLIMCFSPIVYEEQLIGSISCGPALLWEVDEVAKKEFLEKTSSMNIHLDIDESLRSITSCSCTNMTGAAQILFIIANNLIREHGVYLTQQAQKTEQQAKIAELIIDRKKKTNFHKKKITIFPVQATH
jgi:ligand-binding sensor protein